MANLSPKPLAPLFLWAKGDRSLNSLPAQNVDTFILVMIDYRIVEMIGKRCWHVHCRLQAGENRLRLYQAHLGALGRF
jgi:hypothetical protein